MIQKTIVNTLKIIFIISLVIVIALTAILQWKGDAIAQKVISKVDSQLEDSLRYEGLHLEWFSYFPSIALRVDGLKLGADQESLIDGGHVDIVLALFPLFHENIIINRLFISDSRIHIIKLNDRWSYDIFKKSDSSSESSWNASVNEVNVENTKILYDDHEDFLLSLDVEDASLKGILSGKLLDADIRMNGVLVDLVTSGYKLPSPLPCELSGNYKHDLAKGDQEYNHWKLISEGMEFDCNASTQKENDREKLNAEITWKNGDAEKFKKYIPAKLIKNREDYTISGNTEGQLKINGTSTNGESTHITCVTVLKNGSVKIPGQEGMFRNIFLTLSYDSGDATSKKHSSLVANLEKGSFQGKTMSGMFRIDDINNPSLTMDLKGSLPAGFLNLFSASTAVRFQNGVFDIRHFKVTGLILKNNSFINFISKCESDFSLSNARFSYYDDKIEISRGNMLLDHAGKMTFDAEQFKWNKASANDVKCVLNINSEKVDYAVNGSTCQGLVESKGNITFPGQHPLINADWLMKGVEMKDVMASFENFDQTFITSDNIKGKTNIWAHARIPYDASGNIRTHEVSVQAAVDIKNGELQDMKTLEDFSKYIHLEDLKDIHFNEFRNYIKIEDGKVFLPVMFVQSNAINLSISGTHEFDEHIFYNLKINAGQAVANKLRRLDMAKHLKQARKSGWINLYYVLSGTTSSVQYAQDQKKVLSGFEQSAALKESLRSYLTYHFGYDVYWIEPNEWEDIPEYE